MKVSFDHRETTTGLIFQKQAFEVRTTVEFTAEERAILQHQNLSDYVVLDREPSATIQRRYKNHEAAILQANKDQGFFALRVKDLLKGPDVYDCNTVVEAKAYERDVTEGLKKLKNAIAISATAPTSKTFEL